MKKIIKKIFISLFASIVLSSAFAYEWGGLLNVKANPVSTEDISFQGTNDLYFWFNTALNKNKTLFLNSEIQYELAWVLAGGNENALSQIIDVDLLKVSGSFVLGNNSTVDIAFGRYPISDVSGAVFSQPCDGIFASYTLPLAVVSGYVGYTGLLNALNASMLSENGIPDSTANNFYVFAHPYLPASMSVEFPVLFGNQSLSLQTNAFIDLKDSYNRYYANLVMAGPVNNSVYYRLASSFGSSDFKSLMNYTALSVILFPSTTISVNVGAEYASGNQAIFTAFRGFSSRVAYGSSLSPQTTGMLIPNASFAWSLGNAVYAGASGKFIMSMPESSIEKTAIEFAGDFIYNIYSDFQVGLNIDWYCPISNKASDNDVQKIAATLNVGISF